MIHGSSTVIWLDNRSDKVTPSLNVTVRLSQKSFDVDRVIDEKILRLEGLASFCCFVWRTARLINSLTVLPSSRCDSGRNEIAHAVGRSAVAACSAQLFDRRAVPDGAAARPCAGSDSIHRIEDRQKLLPTSRHR